MRITKTNISLGCLDPNTLKQIFLEIAWQNWYFKIGLSLFDFQQLLFDNGNIVHCGCVYLKLPICKLKNARRWPNSGLARSLTHLKQKWFITEDISHLSAFLVFSCQHNFFRHLWEVRLLKLDRFQEDTRTWWDLQPPLLRWYEGTWSRARW